MKEEIWKSIKGYEGLYEVSNLGNVKSIGRDIFVGGITKHIKTRLLKKNPNNMGYYIVVLCKCGRSKTVNVHRLVAEAFIPNPNKYKCVNHKDEITTNNIVEIKNGEIVYSNLEWCTYKYNINYGTRTKRAIEKQVVTKKGAVEQLDMKRNVLNSYKSMSEAARAVNCSVFGIYGCCIGKRFSEGGYKWRYKDLIKREGQKICNSPKLKPIRKLTKDGICLCEYKSINDAYRDTNINANCICACAKGKTRTAGGFVWRYSE